MRIVALIPGGIGDQILFFPTLDSLKQAYPSADIDVVIEPQAKPAYRICQSVDELIAFDFSDRNSPADWANLLGIIRDRYYDIALTTKPSVSIGLLLWLTGTPNRVGYQGAGSLWLTASVPLKPEQYKAQMYHDLLKALDISRPCPALSINLPKGDIDWAETERNRLELGESGYVLIHIGASRLSRSDDSQAPYPIESWQTIIQDFQNRQPDLPLVLVQEPERMARVEDLARTCPGVKVVQPDGIGQLAAMIAGANLVLCVEGTPMQLAVALDVYTLALFGASDPAKQLPKSDKFQALQSPTGQISDITPQMVLERIWGG